MTDTRSRPWLALWGVVALVFVVGVLGYIYSAVFPRNTSTEVSDDLAADLLDFERVALEIGAIDGAPPEVRKVTLVCDSSSDGESPGTTVSFAFHPGSDPETFYRDGLASAGYVEVDETSTSYLDLTETKFRRDGDLTVVWLTIDERDTQVTLNAQPAVAPC